MREIARTASRSTAGETNAAAALSQATRTWIRAFSASRDPQTSLVSACSTARQRREASSRCLIVSLQWLLLAASLKNSQRRLAPVAGILTALQNFGIPDSVTNFKQGCSMCDCLEEHNLKNWGMSILKLTLYLPQNLQHTDAESYVSALCFLRSSCRS